MGDVASIAIAPADGAADHVSAVRAAAQGDDGAFRALYAQHGATVYNIALRSTGDRHDAEDISQDVWIKAHRSMHMLRDPQRFAAWLYRMTATACIDASRRHRPTVMLIDEETAATSSDPERMIADRDAAGQVWEVLAGLPVQQHLALFLKDVEGRSYRQIASALGVSETAVGLLLFRGRRSFARAYQKRAHSTPGPTCDAMRPILSKVVDEEANPVERRAAIAHTNRCKVCRRDVVSLREGQQQYASLALLPVPAALTGRILAAAGQPAASGIGAALHVVTSLLAGTKSASIVLVAGGALTATALITPGDGPSVVPPPAGNANVALHQLAPAQDAGSAVVPAAAPAVPADAAPAPPVAARETAPPPTIAQLPQLPAELLALPLPDGLSAVPLGAPPVALPDGIELLPGGSLPGLPATPGVAQPVQDAIEEPPPLDQPALPALR